MEGSSSRRWGKHEYSRIEAMQKGIESGIKYNIINEFLYTQ